MKNCTLLALLLFCTAGIAQFLAPQNPIQFRKGKKNELIYTDSTGATKYARIYEEDPFLHAANAQYAFKVNKETLLQATDSRYNINTFDGHPVCRVGKDGKYGLANAKLQIVLPIEYKMIEGFGKAKVAPVTTMDDKFGLVNDQGVMLLPPVYSVIYRLTPGLFLIKSGPDGKSGFCDNNGALVVPIEYDVINQFYNGYSVVGKDGKFGYIDEKGKLIQPMIFDAAESASKGQANIVLHGKSSRINMTDKITGCIPGIFNNYREMNRYLGSNCKYGYADKKGRVVIEPQFDDVGEWESGTFATIVMDGKYGRVDKKGTVILAPKYDWLYGALAKLDGKYGLIGPNGEVLAPFEYDMLQFVNDAWIVATKNGKSGFIDYQGNIKIPLQYDEVKRFEMGMYIYERDRPGIDESWGLAAVKFDGKWGYINRNNRMVLPFLFTDVHSYSEGLCWATRNGTHYAAYDKDGKKILPASFTDVKDFEKGLAKVTFKGTPGKLAPDGMFHSAIYENDGMTSTKSMPLLTREEEEDNEQYGYVPKTSITHKTEKLTPIEPTLAKKIGEWRKEGIVAHKAKDYETAFEDYKKGADAGDGWSAWYLATLYAEGKGTPVNEAEGIRMEKLAADKGVLYAMRSMGDRNYFGAGIPKNDDEAFRIYSSIGNYLIDADATRISDEDYDLLLGSMSHLATLYYTGRGTPVDYKQATAWASYVIAESFGDENEMALILGTIYYKGLNPEIGRDDAMAKSVLRNGAGNGDEACKKALKEWFGE